MQFGLKDLIAQKNRYLITVNSSEMNHARSRFISLTGSEATIPELHDAAMTVAARRGQDCSDA
jgi:hypothetical protein